MNDRKSILIVLDRFLPGFLGGGPVFAVANMTSVLVRYHDVSIVTRNNDLDGIPYVDIEPDVWIKKEEGYRIMYLSINNRKIKTFKKILREQYYDYVHVNSFYSLFTRILLTQTNRLEGRLIIAPRGEFNPGAIALGKLKKSMYIKLIKSLKLPKKIRFHATNPMEQELIKKYMGASVDVKLVTVLSSQRQDEWSPLEKVANKLNLVLVSRVHRIKNIAFAIEMLGKIKHGEAELTIIGPPEDTAYLNLCLDVAEQLPEHLNVRYLGGVNPEQLPTMLTGHHFFILPTNGENFGHVIFEALLAGKPVIISDRTPWLGLQEKGIGWDLPLEDPAAWGRVLEECLAMDNERYSEMSRKAWQFAYDYNRKPELVTDLLALFS